MEGLDYHKTFSHVIKMNSLQIMFVMVAKLDPKIH
jgi:hypothetical protein